MADAGLRTLIALRRLRHVETDEARGVLARALAEETTLAARDVAIGSALRDARAVSGDFDREGLAAFLGRMRDERVLLAEAMRQSEVRTVAARAMLANRRVAETVAEGALNRARSVLEAEAARRDQVMLEDVARASRRRR
jgi:hypothetical protein